MRTTTSLAAAGLLSLAGLLAAGPSLASPIVIQTAPGAMTSGGPVSAAATFTLSANALSISLSNLLTNPNNVGQLLSGLSFTINGFTSGTLTSSSGQFVTVGSGGVPSLGTTGSTGWVLQSGFDLCDICSSGKGTLAPAGLIIGPAAQDGNYDAANGSIANNSAHNPFINQTATFNLSIAGLSANDSVSSVLFRFGTTYGSQTSTGECTSGCTATVPEPSVLALFAVGLGALGIAVSRQRRRTHEKS